MIKDFLTRILGETRNLGKGPNKHAYSDYVYRVLDGGTLQTQNNPNYIKLADVNAPELDTPKGLKVKDYLARILEGNMVSVEQVSTEDSGRPVAKVWYGNINVNDDVNGYIDAQNQFEL